MNKEVEEVTQIAEDENELVLSQANVPAAPVTGMPAGWTYNNNTSLDNIRKARAAANMKHGMYSGVPIICRGATCPFRETCWIPAAELEVGTRCPIEVGAIMERFESYGRELNMQDDDTVDHSIVKDVIDIEIMMLRADNSLAISGDFIEEVVAGVDSQGRSIKRPEVHKALEVKMKLRTERLKLLNQLNSTRKDKKQEVTGLTDPSSIASALMQKVRALQEEGRIIDAVPVEIEQADVSEKEVD